MPTPTQSKVARTPLLPPRRNPVVAAGVICGVLLGGGLLTLFSGERPEHVPTERAHLSVQAADDRDAGTPADSVRTAPRQGPRTPRVPRTPPAAMEILTSRYDWPPEPSAPAEVDATRFTEALAQVCDVAADSPVRTWYAGFVLTQARAFGSDPFLLGALMAARSRCDPTRPGVGVGPTGLLPELYEPDLANGRYHYRVFADGAWQARTLTIDRFPFERAFLSAPESNLYFAAAFLRAQEERARGLAASLPQADYRHYVSHFVWGDLVGGNRQEDRILVERRRLLEYYGAHPPAPPVTFHGVRMGCPLDGCPRVITSTLGDSRAGGTRAHRGADFESSAGEPVRAVADGKVLFAGADLPGAAHQGMPIYAQRAVAGSLFGAGGIYVCIGHGDAHAESAVMSCYMHLQAAMVDQGRLVRRGDQIGRVGKTGIKESAPHLHFELHADGRVHAATEGLPGLVLGTPRNTPLPGE
ncbi:MAG: M23 family metallopeptidase [Polyangiales bacterium]